MTNIGIKILFKTTNLILVLLTLQFSSCTGQVKEKSVTDTLENEVNTQPITVNQSTVFPQIHTNLNGMVSEFVRSMYQDKKGTIGLEQMEMVLSIMMDEYLKKSQLKVSVHILGF